MTRRPIALPTTVTYRVEHRDGGRTTILGIVRDVAPHHRTLDPFVGFLVRRGDIGEVVLIDEATERVVARRRV